MRPIKFRTWDGESMKLWGFIDNAFYGPPSSNIGSGTNPLNTPHMQFTGITDSKGVEVYEGDIVRRDFESMLGYETGAVTWGIYNDDEYVSTLECWIVNDWPISDFGGGYSLPKRTITVIGNIHENPELMEGE